MALIVDNTVEDSEHLVMADDGTGWSIKIPSFIIRKKSGDLIKEAMKQRYVYIRGTIEMVLPPFFLNSNLVAT